MGFPVAIPGGAKSKKDQQNAGLFAEEEGLEPPSLTAAVFKTADLPISLFLQARYKIKKECIKCQ